MTSRSEPASLLCPVVACVLAAVGLVAAAFAISPDTLRGALQRWEFWALEAIFLGFVATSAYELRHLRLPRPVVATTAVVGVLSTILNGAVAPRTNRIYYDEHIYQGVAQNLSDLQRAQMCNDGTLEYGRLQCWRAEFNKEPIGYPHLLSVVYRLFGVNERAASWVNNVVGGLTAAVVVVLGWLLFANHRVGGFAGLVLAPLPMQLWWSNTAASEPLAALLTAVAVVAVVHFARAQSGTALAWTVVSTAYATTARPESLLAVPLVCLVLWLLDKSSLQRPLVWWGATGGVVLLAVSILHLAAVRNDGWGTSGARFGWQYVKNNLPLNTWFYLGADDRFPPLVAVAALFGLVVGAGWRITAVLASYFVLFWGVFVWFYAGSYYYGADVRYALLSHVPLVLLAGAGLARASEALRAVNGPRSSVAVVAAAVLVQASWVLPTARSTGEEAWAARADVVHSATFLQRLPRNSIVLTHNPSVFHLWGQNAAQLSIAVTEPGYVRGHLLRRYAGGVYIHWGFWCNVADRTQTEFCRTAVSAFPVEEVASAQERDYVYRLLRVRTPSP